MKWLIMALTLALTGCATTERYRAGENFSTVSGGSCGTRSTVKGSVPWCSIPDDGDPHWDSRNQ